MPCRFAVTYPTKYKRSRAAFPRCPRQRRRRVFRIGENLKRGGPARAAPPGFRARATAHGEYTDPSAAGPSSSGDRRQGGLRVKASVEDTGTACEGVGGVPNGRALLRGPGTVPSAGVQAASPAHL